MTRSSSAARNAGSPARSKYAWMLSPSSASSSASLSAAVSPSAAAASRAAVDLPAAGVVGEAMVAFVLASAYRAKFGGDHIDDVR